MIPKVGKKRATQAAKIINYHKYFFLTIKEATRCHFLIELAKFFDSENDGQTLTLISTINYAEKCLSSFSKDNFKKYHKQAQMYPGWLEDVEALSIQDLEKIKKRIIRNDNKIERLKTYRDKFLAHDDKKKRGVNITKKDVKVLMKIVEDTIDLFCKKLEFSSNDYRNFKKEPRKEFDFLMTKLMEQEKQRINEFEKQYKIKIKN